MGHPQMTFAKTTRAVGLLIINSITESFPLGFFLVLCATVAALPVVQPHWARVAKEEERAAAGGRDKAAFLKRCDIIFN
jgi:hypothetical protein